MSSRKILYVIGSMDLGGAERHLALIAPRLKALGWEPTIYCISRRGVQSGELERNGVPVIGPAWEGGGSRLWVLKFLQLFASAVTLFWIMLRDRPQIVHLFLPLAYVIGAPLALLARVPVLLMSRRSLNYYQAQHAFLTRVEFFLHGRMDAILANSRAVFNQLVEKEGCERSKVSIIYNGVDTETIGRTPPAAMPEFPGLVLIIVANLIRYKGHSDLIEALAGVRDRLPPRWTLLCVGRDDGIRPKLEAQVREAGLGEHIRFLGERTDVNSLIKRADIGILCSHEEGFANAILEGMAAGLPMVATDVGGNTESVVDGETGLIVPARNPQMLGAAILKLASDEPARKSMGLAARQRAEELFSLSRCVDEYAVRYHGLLDPIQAAKAARRSAWRRRFDRLRMSPTARYAAIFGVTLLTFFAALSAVDLSSVWTSVQDLSITTVLTAVILLLVGVLLATLRFRYMASDVGYSLSARDAMLALGIGQIAGAITVQFFGQIAARSIVLGPQRLSPPVNILLVTYERFVAAAVSATFAIIGAWYLFGHIALDLETGGLELLRILLGLVTAIAAAALFGWGNTLLKSIPGTPGSKILISMLRTIALTALIQICTMVVYVIIARALSSQTLLPNLWASAAVVAFAASLPISFAGWGVRELSAVLVLGLIGIGSGPALTISIMIGALSLVALVVVTIVALFMPRSAGQTRDVPEPAAAQFDIFKLMQRAIPLMAATAIFFQIHVPVGTTILNVNLADPVAVLGGSLFFYYYVLRQRARWRLSGLGTHVVIATAVIAFAFWHGYSQYGWQDWTFNKAIGWLVLLAYGGTGALIVASDRNELNLLLRTFVGTAVGIVTLDLALVSINSVVRLPEALFNQTVPLSGFSQNRNAFSFIILLAVCGAFVMPRKVRPWVLGILGAGLWFAGSRAALGVLAVALVVALWHRALHIRTIVSGTFVTATLVVIIAFVVPLFYWLLLAAGSHLLGADVISIDRLLGELNQSIRTWPVPVLSPSSDIERFDSLFKGYDLFRMYPIFGAGLGAYLQVAQTARQVIIHSTPIWLLAEMGIVGFLVFAIPAIRMLWREWMAPVKDTAGKLLILILLVFAIMSTVHELLYQRAMWLLLGAALAYVPWRLTAKSAGTDPAAAQGSPTVR